MMSRSLLSAAVLLIAAFSAAPAFADEASGPMLFPELVSVDGENAPIHPPIGQGKWTLVMLWATSCHICEIDKPLFSAFHEKHKESDVTVFGISIDGHQNVPSVQSYLKERDVTFPNSVGEFLTVGSSMIEIAEESLRGTPTYLLFDPKGEILGVHAGHLAPEKVEEFIASK